MALTLVNLNNTLAVSLKAAQTHLNISTGSTDATEIREVEAKIRAAAVWCERNIGGHRCFIKRTWKLTLPDFPCSGGRIEFPRPPLASITKVAYYDSNNSTQNVSSTVYDTVIPTDEPGWIEPKATENWPDVYDRPDAVNITFVAGYSSNSTGMPKDIHEAVLTMVESLYDPTRLPLEEGKEIAKSFLNGREYGSYA